MHKTIFFTNNPVVGLLSDFDRVKTVKKLKSNVKVDGVLNSDVRSPDSPTSRERLGCSVADVNQCKHLFHLSSLKTFIHCFLSHPNLSWKKIISL